jgi:CorA-like Mg2+ transporter protein
MRLELTRFQRILGPMVANRLERHDLPCIDPDVRPYFRDVADHVRRVAAMASGLRDVMSTVFEASTLLEQQRQGATNRQLAAWAAILAVPTPIAGIYSMNFDFMPELRWRYGHFIRGRGYLHRVRVSLHAFQKIRMAPAALAIPYLFNKLDAGDALSLPYDANTTFQLHHRLA